MSREDESGGAVPGWGQRLIAGPRVFLRYPTLEDFDEMRRLREVSKAHLTPWEPRWSPGRDPSSPEGYAGRLALEASPNQYKLWVCRREDGRILGSMSLNGVVRGMLQNASLGYWTGAPFIRQGYTSEALQLALAYAFEDLGLHRASADIRPENAASIALVLKAGFRLEGFSPRMVKIAGAWADHERYALLVDEWARPLAPIERP